jgi:hypothetical protein
VDDPISSFTVEEYVSLTGSLIFEVRNDLVASVGYGDLAPKALDPSHPAFTHVAAALKSAERAFAAVKQFDHEFYRRRQEAEKRKTDIRDIKK